MKRVSRQISIIAIAVLVLTLVSCANATTMNENDSDLMPDNLDIIAENGSESDAVILPNFIEEINAESPDYVKEYDYKEVIENFKIVIVDGYI